MKQVKSILFPNSFSHEYLIKRHLQIWQSGTRQQCVLVTSN